MKELTLLLSAAALLGACAPTPIPQPSPTLQPAPTPLPTQTVAPPPTVAPVATITFDTDSCSYDGPQSLPAADSLIVTWRINTNVGDVYALSPFITDEQHTREELLQALEGLDMHRPSLPAGLTSAGTTLTLARGSLNVTVRAHGGPLHGMLYFSCWAAGVAYDVLGPIQLQ